MASKAPSSPTSAVVSATSTSEAQQAADKAARLPRLVTEVFAPSMRVGSLLLAAAWNTADSQTDAN